MPSNRYDWYIYLYVHFVFCSAVFSYDFLPVLQFLSLLNSESAFNCEVIRDCYEAFALYCFERYLIACLGNASLHNNHIKNF